MVHPTDSMLTQVTPGLEVKTFDGRKLGMVETVGDSGFLTRRRYREGFWLPEGLVRDVNTERVLLHIDSRVLPRYSRRAEGPKAPLFSNLSRSRAFVALGIVLASGLALIGAL
jgi:hypothetical protein